MKQNLLRKTLISKHKFISKPEDSKCLCLCTILIHSRQLTYFCDITLDYVCIYEDNLNCHKIEAIRIHQSFSKILLFVINTKNFKKSTATSKKIYFHIFCDDMQVSLYSDRFYQRISHSREHFHTLSQQQKLAPCTYLKLPYSNFYFLQTETNEL